MPNIMVFGADKSQRENILEKIYFQLFFGKRYLKSLKVYFIESEVFVRPGTKTLRFHLETGDDFADQKDMHEIFAILEKENRSTREECVEPSLVF